MVDSTFTDYYDDFIKKDLVFHRNPILKTPYEKLMMLNLFSKPTIAFGKAFEMKRIESVFKTKLPISVYSEDWEESKVSSKEIKRNDNRFAHMNTFGKVSEIYYVGTKVFFVGEKATIKRDRSDEFLPFEICHITQVSTGRKTLYTDIEINERIPLFKKVKPKEIGKYINEFLERNVSNE